MQTLVSLYVGSRLICKRPEYQYDRHDQRHSTSYICKLCGDVWARELHPLAPNYWSAYNSICPRHDHPDAGSFFLSSGEAYRAILLNDWRRFPKELLIYELSIATLPHPRP